MKIFDCFMFHDELEVLDIRFHSLDPYVDHFVIVEGNVTHSGRPKGSTFTENKDRYSQFLPKVFLIRAELPETNNRMARDNAQRNAISAAFQMVSPPDLVMISDCDEIPDMRTWNGREGVFECDEFYYKLNLSYRNTWNGPCIVRAWRFVSPYGPMVPQDVRNFRDILRPCGRGWHFSWMQGPQKKSLDTAHAELDGKKFGTRLHPGTDEPLFLSKLDLHPDYVQRNKEKFIDMLEPEP